MEARDPEIEKELHATLHTRRELGEEYDSALVESFLQKVGESVDATVDRHVRRRMAEQRMAAARGTHAPSPLNGWGERYGFALVSLVLAVPLSAIAVVNAGLLGLLVSWLGIVGVNVAASGHGFRSTGRDRDHRDSDWDG